MNIDKKNWKLVSYTELGKLIDLTVLDESVFGYQDQFPEALYAYYDGNLTFNNNLVVESLFDELTENEHIHLYGVCINGDLCVSNSILTKDSEDMSRSLVISGDLNAQSVIVGGIRIEVQSNLIADIVFYKENSEGALIHSIENGFSGRLYIDHWEQRIRDKTGKLVDIVRDNCNILTQILVKDVLAPPEEFDLDEDDYYGLQYLLLEDYLLSSLVDGKNIFIN